MAGEPEFGRPWHRHHDPPPAPGGPVAAETRHPTSLEELIERCRRRPDRGNLHALGSHWALSQAARSDRVFLETHDPDDRHVAMGRTLLDVVPARLEPRLVAFMARTHEPLFTLVHIEAGKRIAQLYAELDQVDPMTNDKTLAGYMKAKHGNRAYAGPWGFMTLGGAGGQTVVGAFSTGTHGGDFDRGPLADAVVAIHLVVDGGKHYWIERFSGLPIADAAALRTLYGDAKYGGPGNFEIVRDDDLFNAVVVSAGRFGVIYSAVLAAVPQYSLYERRLLADWDQVRGLIADRTSWLYTDPPDPFHAGFHTSSPVTTSCRFLQIVVCLTPYSNFARNRVGVTQRWQLPVPSNPAGRADRVGSKLSDLDPLLQAPRFQHAGTSFPYSPPDREGDPVPSPTFLEFACANPSFLKGLLSSIVRELEDLDASDGAVVGATVLAVAEVGGGALLLLLAVLAVVALVLKEIIDSFDETRPLGFYLQLLREKVLGPPDAEPDRAAAGLFAWQMIALTIFQSMQSPRDMEAISYAVMDIHDYRNVSCDQDGDSLEVFFDATDPMLVAFVDLLIAFERRQEMTGRSFLGYVSLRFTQQTTALIGMQKWPLTCSMEIAGLRAVSGTNELIAYASALARNRNFRAILHWGQRNDAVVADIERMLGDPAVPAASNLGRWRTALGRLTDNGRLDGFSSAFTREKGLEVVSPALRKLEVVPDRTTVGTPIVVRWDASANPPGSRVVLTLISDRGSSREHRGEIPVDELVGSLEVAFEVPGPCVVGIAVHPPAGRGGDIATSSVLVQVEGST